MELLPVVCLCLLTRCGMTSADGNGPTVVKVEQDSDVILPCSLSTKESISAMVFDWKKPPQKGDPRKEVFFYDAGVHYNNGRSGQSEQFKGRVSHFQGELKNGNASIIIRHTKMADSGDYTCDFPLLDPRQTFNIKLVVGAAPKPVFRILDETDNTALLWCEVHGNPEPEVEWRDSAGNKLPALKSQVSERDGRFYVTLKTTVTKTGNYRCVATQKTISHQIYTETFLRMNGISIMTVVIAVVVTFFVTLILAVVVAVLVHKGYIPLKHNKGSATDKQGGSAAPLNSQTSHSQNAPDPEA